ncbi:glutamate synthase large subunit [Liquorilactobacillus oeni]|uniref:Glutamate synthase large subunit n=1 Tax=Liquorilactobacillus oeni DSM 19972 TaxID=1423777 RepID=A0A0R1M7I0_9LACO|nr:glutamate synthase large subunit [Liquorilactobacillus oeni]KRL04135.1 glutamate synthase large subunit [Liquorilactobacillus oeni DSM 19972]
MKFNNKSMYSPAFEHDACGMGFITQIDGTASHELVERALTMLQRMNHRGGTGAEPDTGDGAGILLSMPDSFFRKYAAQKGFELPAAGEYAVGMLFLPQKENEKQAMLHSVMDEITETGFRVLAVRDVPYVYESCGPTAQKAMPGFAQVIIRKPVGISVGRAFEDELYRLRRHLEKTFSVEEFAIVSFSSRTLCYKGMLHAYQVGEFYPDLHDETMRAAIALIHSRFSTNTFPSWERAQPFRFVAHNGEINTLKRAENWMVSHNIEIYNEEDSDSAKLENCMEYLYRNGRDIPQILLMMVPEAWGKGTQLTARQRAFDEYNASFIAPWDGPAALCFTDGIQVGAALDRNGLRPSRYQLVKGNFLVVASETGVYDVAPGDILEKGILGPADMILVDTNMGKFYHTAEIKEHYAKKHPYATWLKSEQCLLNDLPAADVDENLSANALKILWRRHGYTQDVIQDALIPMAQNGEEPVISMGYDSPLSVLSKKPQSLFTYFKQQFAQVTNPPIDAIREQLVIGTEMFLGADGDITSDVAQNAKKIKLDSPLLSSAAYEKLRHLNGKGKYGFKAAEVSLCYENVPRTNRLEQALDDMFKEAESQIDNGANLLLLTDRGATRDKLIIPVLLAVSGLNNYLVRKGKRELASVIVDTGEACEIHHFATLLGYGASAIHPYGAYATLEAYGLGNKLTNYRHAAEKGIVKVMSRMGISTIVGYQGAQLFEAVGLSQKVVDEYFTGTESRIGGLTLDQIEAEYLERYQRAFGIKAVEPLSSGGSFKFRRDGEHHLYNPLTMYKFQQAARSGDYALYQDYVKEMRQEELNTPTTLRSLWEIKQKRTAVPLSEVEPVSQIVKRFKSGAMSFGSLSQEAHECIAQAMNELGAKSNSGEGGENRHRFRPQKDGRNLNSKIKQVASARFGVNAEYLMSAEEIQIKMAQGAKPGEGGQLPGNKNFPWVAEIRGSVPGVRLISPPPHHDIYSIEDLKQLIHDLKEVNPFAKITVKLVSSTGVGTIAVGVVKSGADKVVISGYDGGTGAAPRNSVRDAGLPWEMGLAEAHQTLALNNLRQRTTLETDGKLMTGRDIAIAIMLGAEEFSFASLVLVSIGCIMMRVCSKNTCPTGIATQNPGLRKLFIGKPEHVKNCMKFLAEDLREEMATLGYRTIDELVGHTENLQPRFIAKGKAKSLDFSRILGTSIGIKRKAVNPFAPKDQWPELNAFAQTAIAGRKQVTIKQPINNRMRTVGARIGGWIAQRFGNDGLPAGRLKFEYTGVAGQSFGAFITQGLELELIGEANDYVGKGLSGGRLIVRAPKRAQQLFSNAPIVGNVACFGATAGEAFFNGRAGERFCVRNSGAHVVVEGIGDHGCEYMTDGVAVVLGSTGRNFGAGMSGGLAYVYDPEDTFAQQCNFEMIELFKLNEKGNDQLLLELLKKHYHYTGSLKAKYLLDNWQKEQHHFVKVYPKEYRQINEIMDRYAVKGVSDEQLKQKAFDAVVGVQPTIMK